MKTASTSAELMPGWSASTSRGRRCRLIIRSAAVAPSPSSTSTNDHPFHVVEGQAVAGDDGQVVVIHSEDHLQGRRSIVYEVRPDLRSENPAARDAARWRDWLASDDGKDYGGRARGLQHARSLEPSARL